MLIILDRDGVINQESCQYIKTPEEWIALPRSLEAIAKLNQAGHQAVVATNQSGIARGLFTYETLEKIHDKMKKELAKVGGHLDGIFYCPHHPDDLCECRKPKQGLLFQIAKQFNVDLQQNAVLIGDALRDIQAAEAANCPAILLKTGMGYQTIKNNPELHVPIFSDLFSAVSTLV